MWSGIWSVATTRIGFWAWIWAMRHCGMKQEATCWFQCWGNITSPFLWKNNILRCWGWHSLLNWIRAITLSILLKLLLRKLEPWFILCFFFLRLFCISINLPYGHVWNTVVMSGLVLLVANWNCWINYKNRYAGLLVLHLLPFLNPWLIVEM